MKKLIATFLFAVGAGVSFTAAATSCEYMCGKAYRYCMNSAADDADAQAACYDAFENCNQSCS
ncbi:MAG: hypothetical protein K0R43_2615 [Pseudoduganella sp.]|jgi:hypothetical protein|nr:hypothetical protein [Pseudoduganella sp.]